MPNIRCTKKVKDLVQISALSSPTKSPWERERERERKRREEKERERYFCPLLSPQRMNRGIRYSSSCRKKICASSSQPDHWASIGHGKPLLLLYIFGRSVSHRSLLRFTSMLLGQTSPEDELGSIDSCLGITLSG